MDYCYISDFGTVSAASTTDENDQMYKMRKKIGNVFPNVKEAYEALDKIKEVLQCQQCVDSEGM